MAVRCQFESSNEMGVFAKLTNKYCLVAVGASENFYSIFETELADSGIPIVHCTVAECRIIGNLVAGNRKGLLLPHNTTDQVRLIVEVFDYECDFFYVFTNEYYKLRFFIYKSSFCHTVQL